MSDIPDLSQKDGEQLIQPAKVTKKTGKSRRRLSYDPKFVSMVSRLVASGHNAADVAFLIGVKKATIEQWKQRYPVFKKAFDHGKDVATGQLIEYGLKSCAGFETEETVTTSRCIAGEWQEVEKKVTRKQVPPNSALIQFFLNKFWPNQLGSGSAPADTSTGRVSAVADGIQKLAGKLSEMAGGMQEPVDVEFEEVEETGDPDSLEGNLEGNLEGDDES
jgi:hypothetical protein